MVQLEVSEMSTMAKELQELLDYVWWQTCFPPFFRKSDQRSAPAHAPPATKATSREFISSVVDFEFSKCGGLLRVWWVGGAWLVMHWYTVYSIYRNHLEMNLFIYEILKFIFLSDIFFGTEFLWSKTYTSVFLKKHSRTVWRMEWSYYLLIWIMFVVQGIYI